MENKPTNEITSPIDFVKNPFIDIFSSYEKQIKALNFLSDYSFKYSENYAKPDKNKFFLEMFGIIVFVNFNTEIIRVRKKANFTVEEVFDVVHIYNNYSNQDDCHYLSISLKASNGYIKKNIKVSHNAKFDVNKFQENLSQNDNYFQITFTATEFKNFMEDCVLSKIEKTIIVYENCGIIKSQQFLGGDFLIDKGSVYRANESGLIPTLEKNVFIKANDEQCFKLPKLSTSNKSPQCIAKNFIKNTCESWGANAVLALLAIGHMIMGLFFSTFKEKMGVPILIIAGVSGSGKSTTVENGNAIFGMDEDFLIAGNSTVYGQLTLTQLVNGMNICIDDLSDTIIESKGFANYLKGMFKAVSRAKGDNNDKKKINKRPACSQAIYSTNSTLPDIPELANRANVITIMKNSLNTDKFKYFGENRENREELSLLLPKLLEFDNDYVISIHKELENYLKHYLDNSVVPRIFYNIAYMWTGLTLLEEIANYTPENIHLEILEYAKGVVEHYKELPTPIDMLIDSLLTLKNHNIIANEVHYKVKQTVDGRVYLTFHKDTMLCAYNHFFRDENRKIKLSVFNNYLKCDYRVVELSTTGYYKGTRKNSVVLDITEFADVWEFSGFSPSCNSNVNTENSLAELETVLGNLSNDE